LDVAGAWEKFRNVAIDLRRSIEDPTTRKRHEQKLPIKRSTSVGDEVIKPENSVGGWFRYWYCRIGWILMVSRWVARG
jgi:hypothetical protein